MTRSKALGRGTTFSASRWHRTFLVLKLTLTMFDEVIGTCCALTITACLDVITGICFDFVSLREYQLELQHGC